MTQTKGADTMKQPGMSRRSFLFGMGSGLAAGAIGASALSTPAAVAAETTAEENPYLTSVFPKDETAYLPVEKFEWTKLEGPIGYEDRQIAASEITRTDTCDFVVVGCGISGLTAMLRAAEYGVKVIGLEKMNRGRNTWESMAANHTKLQAEAGNSADDAAWAEAMLAAGHWRQRTEVLWSFINNSGEAVDFVDEMIRKAGKGVQLYNTTQGPSTYSFIPVVQVEHKVKVPEDAHWNSWWTGAVATDSLLTTAATYDNLEIRYNTAGVQLIQKDGRVTGIIAHDKDGYYAIEAKNGVLLSTGGYEANPGLVQAWLRPEDVNYGNCCIYAPCQGPTGDGHMMGLALGASMDPIPHVAMMFRSGLPDSVMDSSGVSTVFAGSIWVDHNGRRFTNESLPHNYAANAINAHATHGHPVWFIFDKGMVDRSLTRRPDLVEEIDKLKARNIAVEGATIADLAKAMGADAETLEKTITTFNSYFDEEEPTDKMFRRNMKNTAPIKDGPFYAVQHTSKFLCTGSGLTVNENWQVLDREEKVIPGLYASGNTSGGIFAVDYPRHLPSTSIGRCVTSGYVAAKHANKGE